MGNSCSSGQAHKDKDNMSQRSEESSSYQVTIKKASLPTEKQQAIINNMLETSAGGKHSGVILEAATAGQISTLSAIGGGGGDKKPGLSRVLRDVATSSISADSMSLSSPPGTQSPKDFDKLYETSVPKQVQHLNENLQHLLMGRITSARTNIKTNKIVLYVSAADSQDCCIEKGALHNSVYPELRMYCCEKGYELHIVDLHWKTFLEKQQDHEFPELCLGELTRQMEVAYVIPVLFLNNSLGTPLLPITVESADFQMAVTSAAQTNPGAEALLSKWYQLDSAAQPPCYRLQPIGSHIPGIKEEHERERALDEWRAEIERLLTILVNIFPTELRDTYLTTVVEQEVHNTVFMSQELAKRCVWINRAVCNSPPALSDPIATELHRRLGNLQRDLKNQLNEKHVIRLATSRTHLSDDEQVCELLRRQLRDSIDAIIDEHETKARWKPAEGVPAELFQELNQQTNYCQRAAQCSVNREQVLNEIKKYVTGERAAPLVIYGPGGCGKSTLVARTTQCCQQWLPDAFFILRFVGISAQSDTIEQLLGSVANQCTILTYGHQLYCAHNLDTYTKILPVIFGASCLQRRLIILIDGIDQLKSYDSNMISWVPELLPNNIKLVITVTEDHCMHHALTQRLDATSFIRIPLLGESEAKGILMASVMQYNHSVNAKVQDCVLNSVQECTLPLYAKVLAWQTSWWTDKDHDIVPKGHVTQQLQQMLEELETILGRVQIQHALALLTCARHGLTDHEAIDLLAFDAEFHSKQTYVIWAPACLAWSRLTKHLAPFLQWTLTGDMLCAQWKDNMLRQVVENRYKDHRTWAVKHLHDYYAGKWWIDKDQRLIARLVSQDVLYGKCYNRRKLDELPYQCWQLNKFNFKTSQYITDLNWIYDKICGSNCYQILDDIRLANSDSDSNFIRIIRDFIELYSTALNYDGRQFYSHFNHYLEDLKSSGQLAMSDSKLVEALEMTRNPPVTSLVAVNGRDILRMQSPDELNGLSIIASAIGSADTTPAIAASNCKTFDLVTRLVDTDDFVVTVSTEQEEICVWNVHTCCRIRTLRHVPHPINLIPIDKHRCIVLCRRELRVYNLDTGEFVTKLKGVMNQKMPYYGLHDSDHLVALSRNRMYVNLMNIASGDCVTTFKAGEDRFLNSLLVSGDGRVLVCGDETQKPFPLLVWNLKSKKLMYDLRIPHHDFITSLSAITYEGNYVCCVCHEIDEPAPNFIVVYDLQSGTLFKKWKPSCNTVSLAISSSSSCVISGLEDARLLVWDLVTGNCRWSLHGHTAPVTYLRLDPTGALCLSTDTQCRDRSIRLWDINKGHLISVYTPNANISACEVTSGGRHLLLALKNHENLLSLRLYSKYINSGGSSSSSNNNQQEYGCVENNGKIFDLNDTNGC